MGNIKYGMVAAFMTGIALFAVGCTGGEVDSGKENSGQGSGASGSGKDADEAYKYRQCLREHGAKVEEPKEGEAVGIQGDDKKVKKAMEACKDLPGAGGGKEMTQADKDRALKFARCMREHGVNVPDPKFEGGGMRSERLDSDVDKGKFEKAQKACGEQNGR
ncbi:hypothetical protein SSP35_18_00590 [Streptomyces sp. NBRC 110611]|uniref:hypothetical protein n=1 Tax=Streptomyces sp. NBRC 110611 TaxID=1621259 RepID=UPI00082DCC99|nr:hypothetical protein [Streptomyces sp. NBRC 110611]GAU70331.1 hypothetical protein SSP35_18_00590 [Streptomyces sp. NBRC 110611]